MGELPDINITDNLIYINSDEVEKLYFTIKEFENEKALENFIKSVERMVRGSREYRNLIKYIKTELELNNCSVWNNIDSSDVTIELHHAPLTLYDYVEIAIEKRLRNDQPITTFSVSEEVMFLHYAGFVGLIQVSATAHELIHSGKIHITKDQVVGNLEGFIEAYKPYFSETVTGKLTRYNETSGKHEVQGELFTDEKFAEDLEKKRGINSSLPKVEIKSQIKEVI